MKQDGQEQQAREIFEESANILTQNISKNLNDLSLTETVDLFTNNGKFNAELALIVADLLYEGRELLDDDNSKHYALQALLLYKKSKQNPEAPFPLQAFNKISVLENEYKNSSELKAIRQLTS